MIHLAYNDGYRHGLINDRVCPLPVWDLRTIYWRVGNAAGVAVHCAIVEAVYLSEEET